MGKNWKGIWKREGNKIQSTCFSPLILIPILILYICLFIAHGQLQCIVIPILQHWTQHRNNITQRKYILAEVCPILLLTLFFPSLFNKKTSPFTFAHSIVVLFLSFRGLGTYNLGQKIFQIEANTPVLIKYLKIPWPY